GSPAGGPLRGVDGALPELQHACRDPRPERLGGQRIGRIAVVTDPAAREQPSHPPGEGRRLPCPYRGCNPAPSFSSGPRPDTGGVDAVERSEYCSRDHDMSAEPDLRSLLTVAQEAAFVGGRRTLAYYGTGTAAAEAKADHTPVTLADRESERLIRAIIARAFPDHAGLGEEGGETTGDAPGHWLAGARDG